MFVDPFEDVHMDNSNKIALRFIEDKNSIEPEETFELFQELFGVEEKDAIEFINGRKFISDKKE